MLNKLLSLLSQDDSSEEMGRATYTHICGDGIMSYHGKTQYNNSK